MKVIVRDGSGEPETSHSSAAIGPDCWGSSHDAPLLILSSSQDDASVRSSQTGQRRWLPFLSGSAGCFILLKESLDPDISFQSSVYISELDRAAGEYLWRDDDTMTVSLSLHVCFVICAVAATLATCACYCMRVQSLMCQHRSLAFFLQARVILLWFLPEITRSNTQSKS